MPVPTKVWTVPVASRQDPAVPITTSWGNDTWDNLQFLMEWLGSDYLTNAKQNHNHDGVNSAKISLLEGMMPNGSFEQVSAGMPVGWTATAFTGGTVASSTAVNKHGNHVLSITSTVLANGGSSVLQDTYTPVTDNKRYGVEFYYWANVANISSQVEVIWYDKLKNQISSSMLLSTVNTLTVPGNWSWTTVSPANARFSKFKFTGGVPGTGTAVGTVYFDGGRLVNAVPNSLIDTLAIQNGSINATKIAPNSTAFNYTARQETFDTVTGGGGGIPISTIGVIIAKGVWCIGLKQKVNAVTIYFEVYDGLGWVVVKALSTNDISQGIMLTSDGLSVRARASVAADTLIYARRIWL